MADEEQRKKIKGRIFELLKQREIYLTYGETADVNRLTDEIANLEKELREENHGHGAE